MTNRFVEFGLLSRHTLRTYVDDKVVSGTCLDVLTTRGSCNEVMRWLGLAGMWCYVVAQREPVADEG